MKRFNVGDKVVALVTINNPGFVSTISKGKIYSVLSEQFCSKCGQQIINVTNETNIFARNVLCMCRHSYQRIDSYVYASPEFFAKVDDIDQELQQALENEDYELASVLRDVQCG